MIRIGSAGSAGLGNIEGVKYAKKLGLTAFECEFTHGVSISNPQAKEVGILAKELGISLSVHAPYFVNLASLEKAKITASKKRILTSCERAHHLGAKYVVFHSGFYMKRDASEVYSIIKEELNDLKRTINDNKWKVELAPEVTGKATQFGDLDELLKLKKEVGCSLCVDFAHLKARNKGVVDYGAVFKKIKGIKHIHAHFSGIEWTDKGERRHLLLQEKDIKELLSYILRYKVDITIINESPDVYGDAVKIKKVLEGMK
ncbi:MAG: TIM barrel protein [Nanoarchaeota archaeon]